MVFEMTLDYGVVVPLLLGAAIASLVASRLSEASVYTEALRRKAVAGEEAASIDVLRASDLLRSEQVTVAPQTPLPAVLDALVAARRNHLYVVDADGRFAGAVNLHDVNEALRGTSDPSQVSASSLLRAGFETTTPEEPLPRVLERFASQDSERLPVLADAQSRVLLGTVSKRDILSVYSLELLQRGEGRRPGALDSGIDSLVDEVALPADMIGTSFGESRFRQRYGLALLLVRRGAAGSLVPDSGLRFAAGDRLLVFGTPERLAALRRAEPDGRRTTEHVSER